MLHAESTETLHDRHTPTALRQADKPNASVRSGLSFGMARAAAEPLLTIGLITCAVGGTPLSRRVKGGYLSVESM
jgi:hypothetical protein